MIRQLYIERIREALLPTHNDRERRIEVARDFCAGGDLAPLCDFIEQGYFRVFSSRDYRWSNELVLKTAFLITLFNDQLYIMDSELPIERRFSDLSLILRPDMRHYRLYDHLLEFKYLAPKTLGLTSAAAMPRKALLQRPEVEVLLQAVETHPAEYRAGLEQRYGECLRLRTHAVVGLGLERLVWRSRGTTAFVTTGITHDHAS